MKRLFAAIKIHPDEKLIKYYDQLRNALKYDKIKWVDENNLHLTLKFFGETEEEKIDEIIDLIDDAVYDTTSFEISLKNTGIFGSSYKPRVIWFGFENYDPVTDLFKRLKENLETTGYHYDRQNFVPHLTVGRVKFIKDIKHFQQVIGNFKNVDLQKEKISKLILFESILSRKGPTYEVIEEFELLK